MVLSRAGWSPPPGTLPAWNWLPPEGASLRLDLVPLWVRAWYQLPVIARRGTGHGSRLGRRRWVVERTFAWLHASRRLRTRSVRRADTHQAMVSLTCSIICLRNLCTVR